MRKWMVFLLFSGIISTTTAQSLWTIGPMVHWNIGNKMTRASWGVEFAYWNWNHFPYSIDGGMEFGRQRIRLYSEAQTGIGILGLSAGPVLEFQTKKPALRLGFQGSLWANYFGGVNLRFRRIDKHGYFCPGLYVKIPFNARDEYGNPIKGIPDYHHHHDDD